MSIKLQIKIVCAGITFQMRQVTLSESKKSLIYSRLSEHGQEKIHVLLPQ